MDDGGCLSLISQLSQLNFLADSQVMKFMTAASDKNIWIDILIIFILILINGFFSASEMAIVTLNDAKVKKEADEGNKTAKKILKFIANPSHFLATIQVGVTIAGFLSSALAGEKFAGRITALLDPNGIHPGFRPVSVIIITLIVAYLTLVFGELVPKRLALNNPEQFAKTYVGVLRSIDIFFRPFTRLLTHSTNLILHILRISPQMSDKKVSEEEIRIMVDVGLNSGGIHVEESQMIQNIFEFNDKEVSEIMTHRTNIVALSVDAHYEEVIDVALNEKYSRIPIYEDDIDDIVGILMIRDLLYYTIKNEYETFSLRDILRPPYRVPESKHVDALFRDMQKERVSMAIVIDEYGGTSGLVTVEDLLEEIVGNIEDEYDEEEINENICEKEDGSFDVDGRESLEEVKRYIPQIRFDEDNYEDFDTIAGLVIDKLGYIPEEDENPSCTHNNVEFKILSMDDNRVERINLKLIPDEKVDDEKISHSRDLPSRLNRHHNLDIDDSPDSQK
ncbi:MAG: hemolysin family protein [Eubacteriales bacterium]|nr:hemolysin family protein [Eubacteriales bacterium]